MTSFVNHLAITTIFAL